MPHHIQDSSRNFATEKYVVDVSRRIAEELKRMPVMRKGADSGELNDFGMLVQTHLDAALRGRQIAAARSDAFVPLHEESLAPASHWEDVAAKLNNGIQSIVDHPELAAHDKNALRTVLEAVCNKGLTYNGCTPDKEGPGRFINGSTGTGLAARA